MLSRVCALLVVVWGCWIGGAVAEALRIPLCHQIVDWSSGPGKIVPRGFVTYDYATNTTIYKAEEAIDLTGGDGIYRLGILKKKSNDLRPNAFTKLVRPFPTKLT
jgi:hypothetical protein